MKRFLFIILVFLFISGCDTYGMANQYPHDKADVWYCEEIDATIDFSTTDSLLNTVFCWNGETHYCRTSFHSSYVFFLFDENMNGSIDSPNEEMLEGRWKYESKKMVIEIIRSNLFGDAFSELTFDPVYEE